MFISSKKQLREITELLVKFKIFSISINYHQVLVSGILMVLKSTPNSQTLLEMNIELEDIAK